MNDLIKELEGATEGSRELDGRMDGAANNHDGEQWPNHFTTNFDSAYTLIPEGWELASLWSAVRLKDRPWWGVDLRQDDPYRVVKVTKAASPALAICIAVLKVLKGT